MAKNVGVKLPEDLINVLKGEKTVAVLATFSEKGLATYDTNTMCLSKRLREHLNVHSQRSHGLSQYGLAKKGYALFFR